MFIQGSPSLTPVYYRSSQRRAMRSYVLSRKRTKSQQDSLFANPLLAATLESPYLSTTKKEVKYCDHAIIIVSCVYIEFREVVILLAILTIVWFLI
jgi:hypothetical protein